MIIIENKIARFLVKFLISFIVCSLSMWVVLEMESDVKDGTGPLVLPILIGLEVAKFLIAVSFLLMIFSKRN
jgi:hypothetical protein